MRLPLLPASTARAARTGLAVACAVAAALAACGETGDETLATGVAPGDTSLPDAVVTERPPIPPTSYTLACPWDSVADPSQNPYLVTAFGPDQIRSIDAPKWVPIDAPPDKENPVYTPLGGDPVVVVEVGGQVRALPVAILLHHQIVNMCWNTDAGEVYSFLTYCPLADAAVHFFDPRTCKTKNKFGVSGLLFNGNLVVFDRRSRVQGPTTVFAVQMLAGGYFGSCVEAGPSTQVMSWDLCRQLYPNGEVLSGDTGDVPAGGYDIVGQPYWNYWRDDNLLWYPISNADPRLTPKQRVLGVLAPAARKAYALRLQEGPFVYNDIVGGERIVVWKDAASGAAVAHEAVVEGQPLTFSFAGRERHGLSLYIDDETGSYWNVEGIAVDGPLKGKRLPRAMTIRSFWFAWSSMFPDTELMTTE
ncbi:MAG: DUF3179 domain-containing protein [Candidatus Krumholzibacteria bacterium]|nr:DUF3179 domain-containing protein [Candidatus Krumholzibacteria bacterium]